MTGLLWLIVLFAVIAFIVARSIRGTAAMILSLGLVPLCMLGGVGMLRVPVDIISAPATNVCIGMAIDSMVHLMFGVRRAQRDGKKGWSAWVAAREEQWRGIVYSDVIIAAGFAIFFPISRRLNVLDSSWSSARSSISWPTCLSCRSWAAPVGKHREFRHHAYRGLNHWR